MAGVPTVKVSLGRPTGPVKEARHPNTMDVTAALSRHAALSTKVVSKTVPAMTGPGMIASLARAAPKAAPILGKLALPLTVAAATGAAVNGAIKGFERDGVTGAAKGAIRGAADSVTLGLASWAYDKAKKGMGFEDRDMQAPSNDQVAEQFSHFSSANKSFAGKQRAQSAAPQGPAQTKPAAGGPRGWANPNVQAAAQAARGAQYSGPKG